MSTEDDNEGGVGPTDGAPVGRQARRSRKAATSDALRAAFGNSAEGPAPGTENEAAAPTPQAQRQKRAAQRVAPPTTAVVERAVGNESAADASESAGEQAASSERSDRLVSEAVMAGLDAMSGATARVPVGAGGGGGDLPAEPEDRTTESREGGRPRLEPTPVVVPDDDLEDLPRVAPPHQQRDHPLVAIGNLLDSFVRECGEIALLGGTVVKSAILHPKGYWGDVRDQIYDALKLCWVPMMLAVAGFGFGAPGLQGGNILYLFGVPDRLGGFFMFATIREFGPFVEAMVVAGVVGTAITADLGARRIREEIDAMEVLGVDPVRKLILPRVVSTTIMTAFFDLFALIFGLVGGYSAGVFFLTSSPSGFVASFYSQANISDDWGSFVKTALFGFIIGIVCCFKGYRAKGGPAGVGKAVNQAVVISFALIWVVDYTFTNLLLGYAPSTQVIK